MNAGTDPDVLVVGGGLAGLAAAFALTRAGCTVRVLEQHPAFGELGAGIQLAANATTVLRTWGLLDDIIAHGVLPSRAVMRDAVDGSELTHIDLADAERRYGAPHVLLRRSSLHAILLDACRAAGVDLVTDTAVTHIHQPTPATTAATAAVISARRVDRARLVVAADGLHSTMRRHISPDPPRDSGYLAYRSVLPTTHPDMTAVAAAGDVDLDATTLWAGPRYHLVQYPLDRGTPDHAAIVNQVAVFRPPRPPDGRHDAGSDTAAFDATGSDAAGSDAAGLDVVFADSCAAVQRALPLIDRDRHWRLYDRDPITGWVRGRLALIGDAAHPMLQYLGQGACQAIEDAHCLATLLTRHPDHWDHALTRYARIRGARTAHIQRTARKWGELLHADGLLREVRNALLRERRPHDYRHLDWLLAHTLDTPPRLLPLPG